MTPIVRAGIAQLFKSIGRRGEGGGAFKELGIILKQAKEGNVGPLQERLAAIGVKIKDKKDLVIDYADDMIQKLTGGGMDAPLKKGGTVEYKKGGVVRGLDSGTHKRVRLI